MTDQLKPYKISPVKDAATRLQLAANTLRLANLQRDTLQAFGTAILKATKLSTLSNLHFEIGSTPDDEVYISRTSGAGVSNILIYEDGTMAHSFIGYKGSAKPDFLRFAAPAQQIDFENLLVDFFTFH